MFDNCSVTLDYSLYDFNYFRFVLGLLSCAFVLFGLDCMHV